MIGLLIGLAIIAAIISVIEMNAKIKNLIYIIIAIAALLIVLPAIGIHVPLR